MASFLQPMTAASDVGHRLVNDRTGQTLATRLLPAFDSKTRKTGLLKHRSLPDGDAMVIAPCNSIHTFFMHFDIDVAFVGRDGRVLKIRHAMAPWRIAAAFGGFAVVELPAGVLARSGTVVGDTLTIA